MSSHKKNKHFKRRKKPNKLNKRSLANKLVQKLLIGETITIIDYYKTEPIEHTGVVVDETKNMLVISLEGKEKKFPKNRIKIIVTDETIQRQVVIEGNLLLGRPEERLKSNNRKMW